MDVYNMINNKLKKILFLNLTKRDFEEPLWKRLDMLSSEKVFLPTDSPRLFKELETTDCLLINQGMVADQKMIKAAPLLKYVGILASGYNRIDTVYAASKKVAVCNVPGYATEAVAEFVLGTVLDQIRELERAKKQARENNYSEATFNGVQIKDKTFGIIGLGRIGQRVAELALGFGAKVVYWSRERKKALEKKGVVYKSVKQVLKSADILSTHLSFAKQTLKFFNKKTLSLIKSGAIFVNTAPMELIDLKALEASLKKNNMTFVLDHSDEMTSEDIGRLKKYKNCIIYPPIGFRTKEASILKKEIFIDNLENFLQGSSINKVN